MPKWTNGSKKDKTKSGSKASKQMFVPKFKFFAKSALAPYPDEEDGCPFYFDKDCKDEKELFSSGHITQTRTQENCEMFHRAGMAVCLAAGAADHGAKLLNKRLPVDCPKAGDAFDKTGLPGLMELLRTERGNDFVLAMELLNVGRAGKPEKSDVESGVESMLKFFKKDGQNLRKHLSRTASFCATQYLFAMNILEHLDLYENRPKWAKSVQDEKKQTKEMRAWMKDAEDSDKYAAAIVSAFMEKVKANKVPKGKKKKAADTSSDGDHNDAKKKKSDSSESSSNTGDSSDSSASGGSNRKKVKKPLLKAKKRRLSSSDSAGAKQKRRRKDDKKKAAEKDKAGDGEDKKDGKEKKHNTDKAERHKDKGKQKATDGKRPRLSPNKEDLFAAAAEEEEDMFAEAELTPEQAAWASWEESDIQALKNAIVNCDGKPETLDLLKDIEKKLPDSVKNVTGLKKTCETVKSLQKMPKLTTVVAFIEKLKVVSDKALKWKDDLKALAEDSNDKQNNDDKDKRPRMAPSAADADTASAMAPAAAAAPEATDKEKKNPGLVSTVAAATPATKAPPAAPTPALGAQAKEK